MSCAFGTCSTALFRARVLKNLPVNETIVCLLLRRDVLNALPISISLLSKSTTMTWKLVSPVNRLASVSWLIKWCTHFPCSLTGRMKYTVALLFQLIPSGRHKVSVPFFWYTCSDSRNDWLVFSKPSSRFNKKRSPFLGSGLWITLWIFFKEYFLKWTKTERWERWMHDRYISIKWAQSKPGGKLFRILGGCVSPSMTYLIRFLYGSSDLATIK